MIIVTDTSSLIDHPELLQECYPGDDIVISVVVLEELDGMKNGSSAKAAAAREVLRIIDSMEPADKNKGPHDYIRGNGGYILISHYRGDPTPDAPTPSNDRIIIETVKRPEYEYQDETILLTQDKAMTILAKSIGVKVQRHESTRKTHTGKIATIDAHYGAIGDMYADGFVEVGNHGLNVNTGVILKEGNLSALGIVEDKHTIKHVRDNLVPCGVYPADATQKIAVDLLAGGHGGAVTEEFLGALSGRSGSGKTTLAIAAGIQAVKNGYYDRIMVFRPSEPVGKDLGFLPGTLEEKMEPWKQAIYDVVRDLGVSDGVSIRKEGGVSQCHPLEDILSIENINFVRGRTFTNTFVIVDEAQNLSVTELRTLASRCGRGSAFVCTFDPSQVDNAYLRQGRAEGVERFLDDVQGHPAVWHIQLSKPVRGGVSAIVE